VADRVYYSSPAVPVDEQGKDVEVKTTDVAVNETATTGTLAA
jgi:hypothetical protein